MKKRIGFKVSIVTLKDGFRIIYRGETQRGEMAICIQEAKHWEQLQEKLKEVLF